MKKTLVFIGILATTACSSAQNTETKENEKVPNAVTEAFAKKYPAAKDVDWDEEGYFFKAEFEIDHQDYSTMFDSSGKFMQEEKEMDVTALPKAVRDCINTNYRGKQIEEVNQVTFSDGTVEYEAKIQGEHVDFDQNGHSFSNF